MSTREVKTALSNAFVIGSLVLTTIAAMPAPAQVCGPLWDGRVANVVYQETAIVWEPVVEYEQMVLTIAGPCEDIVRVFRRGEPIFFDIREVERVQDGAYTWELRRAPILDPSTQGALAEARAVGDDSIWWNLWQSGAIPQGPYVDSASFLVARGVIVPPGGLEEEKSGRPAKTAETVARPVISTASKGRGPKPTTAADQVIPDDLIVQGSLCVGFDCVNNENFSFDTIRLKENNTRIKFDDTSTITGYPANDWQLTANDSASGGASKFSIEDISGAKVPFTIRAGAASNSIFVDSTGRVGFRTSTPVLDLHVNTSNTPAVRLEQNNSGGFTAQTWDIAGNEANFFVRDVTSGSKLPLRIRPGAPTSSIDIAADGDVGIGDASPDAKLDVEGSNGSTALRVEETNGTAALRILGTLKNNGGTQFNLEDSSLGVTWALQSVNGQWRITDVGDATNEMLMDQAGNVTFAGTVTPGSSRTVKEQFSQVDPRDVLQQVLGLPITSWSYKAAPGVRHVGPMSEDFYAAFQVGADDKGISVTDSAGVALAAIQGLHSELKARDAEIASLRAQLEKLAAQLEQMKAKQ